MKKVARFTFCLLFLATLLASGRLHAQTVMLKDGRVLEGKVLPITGVADSPIVQDDPEGDAKATPILLIDDNLRRTFISKYLVAEILERAPEQVVRIRPWQNVAKAGSVVTSVGPSLGITPFDEYGRRIYRMQTARGPLDVIQGITELTPRYARVEGLMGSPKTIVWDMRLATSSIPPETLSKILSTAVSKEKANDWLKIVRFYLQTGRFKDARRELEAIVERFPEMQGLEAEVRQLRQMGARRILREINLRREAGQHVLATALLDNFPVEKVDGETLQEVREALAEYETMETRIERIRQQLKDITAQIADPDHRRLAETIVAEVVNELSPNNVDRLAPFAQLADDASMSAGERISLAVTGWLLGAGEASQELAVAVSLMQVRDAVREYLRETIDFKRTELLNSVRSLEGANVERVAKLIAHMAPPWEVPAEAALEYDCYALMAPGQTENGDFPYLVQLPPEYDRSRRYPTIIALNGASNSAEQELEFWAGGYQRDERGTIVGARRGQAMRHGYIVISIDWHKPQQYQYEYSLREHEAVQTALRDATRRFNIDTDRVFLTGHDMGGDAVWDLAQSHPDLWAGVIPFVARGKKYVPHYWQNAAYVPLYFVTGELDGRKMAENSAVLDKYLLKRFDTTIVEFLGRGQEPFHDEVLNVFAWMGRHRRDGSPKQFKCDTMRPWDNFFWWIEGQEFANTVHPANWQKRGARTTLVEGRVLKANSLSAKTSSERTTFWLSPDLVDFSQPISISYNGKKLSKASKAIRPDIEVLLEDVRTRGERLRPFWAKVVLE